MRKMRSTEYIHIRFFLSEKDSGSTVQQTSSKQVAKNEKKARQNLQDRDEQLVQLQQELQQDARRQANQQAKDMEQRVHATPSVQKRMNSQLLMAGHREIREQRAIALKAAADKELEIVQAMQAQEEAQHAAEEAQKAAALMPKNFKRKLKMMRTEHSTHADVGGLHARWHRTIRLAWGLHLL